jgi:hypothetical protein
MDYRYPSDKKSAQSLLSVVVITVYNSIHLSNCLNAIKHQVDPPELEIIAVCDDRVKNVSEIKEKFPLVRFIHIAGIQTQEKLRSEGVTIATGKIIVLTVDHCTPEKHWCKRIMEQHAAPYAAVGGGLEIGDQPETAVNLAVHFYDYCNYGYFQNPVIKRLSRNLSDANVSYKKEALERVAEYWQESFHVSFVNKALLDLGEKLLLSPDIIVYQNRSINLGRAVQVAYRRGRVFASKRIIGATLIERTFYSFFSLFLPILLLGRLFFNIFYKRVQLFSIARAFPFIVLFSALWSYGEFIGYITGKGWYNLGETYD